jgi:hypothetical protein
VKVNGESLSTEVRAAEAVLEAPDG